MDIFDISKVKGNIETEVEYWNGMDVVKWIISLDKERYLKYAEDLVMNVEKEEVDGSCLNDLDVNDLHRLGVTGFKDKKYIFKAIQKLIHDDNKNSGNTIDDTEGEEGQ